MKTADLLRQKLVSDNSKQSPGSRSVERAPLVAESSIPIVNPDSDSTTGIVKIDPKHVHTPPNTSPEDYFDRMDHPSVPRDRKGRVIKGHSLNPAGRAAAPYISKLTGHGREMIDQAVKMMRGELTRTEVHVDKDGCEHEVEVTPSFKERTDARRDLMDRLWGKAPQIVKLEDERAAAVPVYSHLSIQELLILREIVAKVAVPPSDDVVEGELVTGAIDGSARAT